MKNISPRIPSIFVIADTHFGAKNWKEEGHPMNYEKLILENLKSTVKKGDTVIHLGDIADAKEEEWIKLMIKASNTDKWILVAGENELKKHANWYLARGFTAVVKDLSTSVRGVPVLFSHQADYSQDKKGEVTKNIHGHTHGRARKEAILNPDYDLLYHLEYSLKKAKYAPLEFKTIINKLSPRKGRDGKVVFSIFDENFDKD
jgi:calcineurin-like phosphoesterase family protein